MARDYGYIISPSLQRYTFQSGKTVSGTFTLTNSFVTGEPESQTFILSTKFVFQENGNKYIYDKVPAGRQPYDMTPWITLQTTEVTIRQNESIQIPYTITVPESPAPGGKYAAIVIEKKVANQQLATSGSSLDDKIAYQILGQIAGTENRNGEIVDFSINRPLYWMWPFDKAVFTVSLSNTGNVEFLPSGEIFVHKGDITKGLWQQPFNPNELVILPDNQRSYEVTMQPQTGFFTSDRNGLTINLDYFRFGRYYATAKIGHDVNNTRIVEDRLVTFWIIPIPLIATILGIFILGSVLRRVAKKLRKER